MGGGGWLLRLATAPTALDDHHDASPRPENANAASIPLPTAGGRECVCVRRGGKVKRAKNWRLSSLRILQVLPPPGVAWAVFCGPGCRPMHHHRDARLGLPSPHACVCLCVNACIGSVDRSIHRGTPAIPGFAQHDESSIKCPPPIRTIKTHRSSARRDPPAGSSSTHHCTAPARRTLCVIRASQPASKQGSTSMHSLPAAARRPR